MGQRPLRNLKDSSAAICYREGFRKHIHLTPEAAVLDQKTPWNKSLFHRVLERRRAALPSAPLVVSLRPGRSEEISDGGRTHGRRGPAAPSYFRRGGERASLRPAHLLRARNRSR